MKIFLKMNNIYSEIPYKEILLLIMGTLSTFLIWRVQHQKDKIKNIESQLSDRKYKMYSELVYIIFDIITGTKEGKSLSEKDIMKRMLDIKKDMFLYAPDDVFKSFTIWTLELNKPNSAVNHFKLYFKMMKLVRKDMGQRGSKIELDDFMLFLMQNEDAYLHFKQEHNW
jgi:hypothetical protein